jgi:hypothetical protein
MSDPSVFWSVPLWCHFRAGCLRTLADVAEFRSPQGRVAGSTLLSRYSPRTTKVALVPLRTCRSRLEAVGVAEWWRLTLRRLQLWVTAPVDSSGRFRESRSQGQGPAGDPEQTYADLSSTPQRGRRPTKHSLAAQGRVLREGSGHSLTFMRPMLPFHNAPVTREGAAALPWRGARQSARLRCAPCRKALRRGYCRQPASRHHSQHPSPRRRPSVRAAPCAKAVAGCAKTTPTS